MTTDKSRADALTGLPPMPTNVAHVMRRIRRCETEAAAQVVLEHFAIQYAMTAIARPVEQPAPTPADERASFSDHDFQVDPASGIEICSRCGLGKIAARRSPICGAPTTEGAFEMWLKQPHPNNWNDFNHPMTVGERQAAKKAWNAALEWKSRADTAIQTVAWWRDHSHIISDHEYQTGVADDIKPKYRPLGFVSARISANETGAEGVRAWETDDGRVISDEQKQQALRDGGASASSVRPFSISLGRFNTAQAAEPVALPQPVLDALRFYANGHHFTIDDDHQQFDTVSGEPQNWLCSERDDDCTMIEDGSIARAALCGGLLGFEEPEKSLEGEVFAAAPKKNAQAGARDQQFPYQKTFNAIAAATSVEGGNVSISVKAFRDAFGDAQADAGANHA